MSFPVKVNDLEIYAGDDHFWHVKVLQNGEPFDLRGSRVDAFWRVGDVVGSFEVEQRGVNEVVLGLSSGVSRRVFSGGWWDLQLTDRETGLVRTLARGGLVWLGDVSPERGVV